MNVCHTSNLSGTNTTTTTTNYKIHIYQPTFSSMAEGDGSSRNFRSAYYEKLGFCGNEEKNILDLLIASSPFDIEKLSDLCERFDLDKRCIEAWKILLGVECGRKNPFDEFANVRRVRAEHFQSLKHHLEVLLRHNLVMKDRLNKCSKAEPKLLDYHKHSQENFNHQSQEKDREDLNVFIDDEIDIIKPRENPITSKSNNGVKKDHALEEVTLFNGKQVQTSSKDNLLKDIETNPGRLITLMYLLEDGRLDSSDIDKQLESTYCRKLSAMALFFVNVSGDLQEAFFLFRNFTRKLEENEALNTSQMNLNKT